MQEQSSVKPRAVVCHICGREFRTASIDIHVPQCAKKWEEVEGQKPAPERRPLPQKPELVPGEGQQEYNKAAKKIFEEHCAEQVKDLKAVHSKISQVDRDISDRVAKTVFDFH
mgnify:CR=1 FL=1